MCGERVWRRVLKACIETIFRRRIGRTKTIILVSVWGRVSGDVFGGVRGGRICVTRMESEDVCGDMFVWNRMCEMVSKLTVD